MENNSPRKSPDDSVRTSDEIGVAILSYALITFIGGITGLIIEASITNYPSGIGVLLGVTIPTCLIGIAGREKKNS